MNRNSENYEPLTERLRSIPRDDWSEADYHEEIAALRKDAQECLQKADAEKWLIDVIAPLAAAAPDTPVSELITRLPEPERSIAHDIVFAKVTWADLPIQQGNREAWHARVEQSVATLLNSGTPFSTNAVLDAALIGSPDRSAARKYAERILRAADGRHSTAGHAGSELTCS